MPQITLEALGLTAPIVVEIPNERSGETEWKRKEQVQKLEWQPSARVVYIQTLIIPYVKLAGDTYGEPYLNKIKTEEHFQIADNTTIVDMQGNILLTNITGDTSQYEAEGGVLHGINWMFEGDYFVMIANTVPVKVAELIRTKVLRKYGLDTTTTTTTIA